eukprot:1146213-Pelagomonas_calceolata.AAC.1
MPGPEIHNKTTEINRYWKTNLKHKHVLEYWQMKRIIPISLLNFESVDMRAKSGHTAHDVFGQIQIIIRDASILGWESTPVITLQRGFSLQP